MTLITADFLTRCGGLPAGAALYAAPLAASCQRRNILTPSRLTPMLANVLNESAALTHVEEDMTYTSATWLHQVYPSRFPTVAAAQPYVRNPDALAAKVYGTADGVDVRGRGLAQLTGAGNYAAYGKETGKTVAQVAAYLLTPEGAADSAVWFYARSGCLLAADRGDVQGVTRLWEGSLIGWPAVQKWHGQVLRAMGGSPPITVHAGTSSGKPPVAPPVGQVSQQQSMADVLDDQFNPPQGA